VFTGIPDFPNVHPYADRPEDVTWNAWLTPAVEIPTGSGADDVVGLFEGSGGGCMDRYRPMDRCLMRQWGEPVCPVCTEQVVKRMYRTFDAIDGVRVEADQLVAESNGPIEGRWWVDGVDAGPADAALAYEGHGEVELRARAVTPWVRTGVDDLDEAVEVRP
jgi:hypothetical protein